MRLWRLTQQKHAADAWRGTGASLFGGRWNHKGYPAVYVSASVALAALEILAHVHQPALLQHYQLFSIEIPDNHISRLAPDYLPRNWQTDPAPGTTMDLGTDWLEGGSSVALLLPSTLVPMEYNALLNPQHPDFNGLLETVESWPFAFDARLTAST